MKKAVILLLGICFLAGAVYFNYRIDELEKRLSEDEIEAEVRRCEAFCIQAYLSEGRLTGGCGFLRNGVNVEDRDCDQWLDVYFFRGLKR